MSPLPASSFSGNLRWKAELNSKLGSARQVVRHKAEVMGWDYSHKPLAFLLQGRVRLADPFACQHPQDAGTQSASPHLCSVLSFYCWSILQAALPSLSHLTAGVVFFIVVGAVLIGVENLEADRSKLCSIHLLPYSFLRPTGHQLHGLLNEGKTEGQGDRICSIDSQKKTPFQQVLHNHQTN